MSGVTVDKAIETVGRVAAVTTETMPVNERASVVLDELQNLIPFVAAEIFSIHPLTGEVSQLATQGYDVNVLENLHSARFFELMESLNLQKSGKPVRMKDLPGDPLDNWAVGDVLLPAGYNEGMTMCLKTSDGRVTGVINLSTETNEHPSDIARDAVAHLCTALANMADQTQSGRWIAMLVGSGTSAIGLTLDGDPISIPGLPEHALLQPGSALIPVAHKSAAMNTFGSFIWPEADDKMMRVRVLPCSTDNHLMSSVVCLDNANVGPLSYRELEVLTLAANGLSNLEIGAALSISGRTVSTHIEHILDKLGAPNRAAAAARAIAEGLVLGRVKRYDI